MTSHKNNDFLYRALKDFLNGTLSQYKGRLNEHDIEDIRAYTILLLIKDQLPKILRHLEIQGCGNIDLCILAVKVLRITSDHERVARLNEQTIRNPINTRKDWYGDKLAGDIAKEIGIDERVVYQYDRALMFFSESYLPPDSERYECDTSFPEILKEMFMNIKSMGKKERKSLLETAQRAIKRKRQIVGEEYQHILDQAQNIVIEEKKKIHDIGSQGT